MTAAGQLRNTLILAVCAAGALLLGYLLANPRDTVTIGALGLTMGLLTVPLVIRWHHTILVLTWNAYVFFIFLPGSPNVWVIATVVCLTIGVVNFWINRRKAFISVPAVTWPLAMLLAVVVCTAYFTGGIGFRALGSDVYGGRRYFLILVAIAGYFALVSQPIARQHAVLLTAGYFLSAVTAAVSNLAVLVGGLDFLYLLFPPDAALQLMQTGSTHILRFSGIGVACLSIVYVMIIRYGLTGIVDFVKPWRFFLLMALLAGASFGGYRSALLQTLLLLGVQFHLERLYRRLLPALILGGILTAAVVLPFSESLPLQVQRSLSFLPLKLDPVARRDAELSLDWRFEMWKIAVREVPEHFWVGKGYALSPSDIYLAEEGIKRGLYQFYEPALVSANYHSGPLTLVIPFGIFGTLAFLWFQGAGLWCLYRNYRYGHPDLRYANSFILSFFICRAVIYWLFYGDFGTDLVLFTGALGLSVSINHGVRSPESLRQDLDSARAPAAA